MASLIFAHAKSIHKTAKREAMTISSKYASSIEQQATVYDNIYRATVEREEKEFDNILQISERLHSRYIAAIGPKQQYFITIRPDDNKCNLLEFKEKVFAFLEKKCFTNYTLSFEQKGKTVMDIGKGFHCHIVAECTQRSKGNVLRDTLSTWNKWILEGKIAENCIDVRGVKNPESIIQNYLIDYKSDDNHKIETKNIDEIWRNDNSLKSIYRMMAPAEAIKGTASDTFTPGG